MKNIFKIHPLTYIFITISLITGNIKDLLIFIIIIIIHEIGHIIPAKIFKWKIEKIILLPLGGLTIFNIKINTSLKQQFIVAITGPIFQIIAYIIIKHIYISERITMLNNILLIFNLLPIYPLDGSKILNTIINIFIPFKVSHKITTIISLILIAILNIKFNLTLELALIFLLIKNIQEIKEHKYIFNKFLFERYIYNLKFKHTKKIKNISSMKIWTKHLILVGNTYETEKKILSKRFDK